MAAWSINTAQTPNENSQRPHKKFHERTNFNKYDLGKFITSKLTHHRNFSCSLYPEAALPRAVNTAGIWFTLLSCAKCFTLSNSSCTSCPASYRRKCQSGTHTVLVLLGEVTKRKRHFCTSFLEIVIISFWKGGKEEGETEKNPKFFYFKVFVMDRHVFSFCCKLTPWIQ